MAKFMYIFRSDPSGIKTMSPEEMQQVMQHWMSWKDSLEQGGHIKQLGERLDWNGKVLRGNGRALTDGPYIEVKDCIQGFMYVEGKDVNQAVELAEGCPLLEGGGSVEIRPLVTM
jgi:hypothetical protein